MTEEEINDYVEKATKMYVDEKHMLMPEKAEIIKTMISYVELAGRFIFFEEELSNLRARNKELKKKIAELYKEYEERRKRK